MHYLIDTKKQTITSEEGIELELYSDEGFEILSDLWLKVGWNQKYHYSFTWMGHPIFQIPEDMIRLQELIYQLKPDVILETGIAYGGSLLFSASLCQLIGHGRVIGVDIDIRPPNRKKIEAHPLSSYITLIEGSSIAAKTIQEVFGCIRAEETVLVILDSNHRKEHVLAELEAYAPLIKKGFYLIVTDGIMKELAHVPRGKKEWAQDNALDAVEIFLSHHPEFVCELPLRPFNEMALNINVSHWPKAYLKKIL